MMKLLPGLFSDAFDDMFYDRSNMKTDIRMKDGNYVLDGIAWISERKHSDGT